MVDNVFLENAKHKDTILKYGTMEWNNNFGNYFGLGTQVYFYYDYKLTFEHRFSDSSPNSRYIR